MHVDVHHFERGCDLSCQQCFHKILLFRQFHLATVTIHSFQAKYIKYILT